MNTNRRSSKASSMNESMLNNVVNGMNKINVKKITDKEKPTIKQSNGITTRNPLLNSTFSIKKQEEILEYKLQNARLTNENNILKEKNNTLKQIIKMKNDDYEIVRNKYNTLLEEYKNEIEKIKRINNEFKFIKENTIKRDEFVRSTISALIEMLEVFVKPKESFVDLSKSDFKDKIQGLVVSKLLYLRKNFSIDIDFEIERVKRWNFRSEDVNIAYMNTSPKFREECSLKNGNEFTLDLRSNFSLDMNHANVEVDDKFVDL
jgi:hypothetical protein